MEKVIKICDQIDKALIEALQDAEGHILQRKALSRLVSKRIKENEGRIVKRIEKRSKDPYNYFIKCDRGIYKLNLDIHFDPIGEPLPPKSTMANPISHRLNGDTAQDPYIIHTQELRSAIDYWINNFPQPTHIYPEKPATHYSYKVSLCENHILFEDLDNHLPLTGNNVLVEWDSYKAELEVIEGIKANLYNSTKQKVQECFKGLDLHLAIEMDESRLDTEYIFESIASDLYKHYWSYYQFYRCIGNDKGLPDIKYLFLDCDEFDYIEKDGSIIWGNLIAVPEEDKDKLAHSIGRLMGTLKNMPDNRFSYDINYLINKMECANSLRDIILSELRGVRLYPILPGDCQYLH
jgi:hypothetical protein